MSEVIEVNYGLVRTIFNMFNVCGINIERIMKTFAQNKYDATKAKKVLLMMKLTLKSDTWVTKDAMLQAEVVGFMFYIYNQCKDNIKEKLSIMCETLTDEAQEGLMEEGAYLECMDILKTSHNVFDGLENLTHAPIGEWATIDDELMLIMYY